MNSHEIIIMPTISMREDDKDYAISFALPADAEGITYIIGRQSCDTRKLEGGSMDRGNGLYGGHESLVVFDNVFVPWDRMFMYKQWEFSGPPGGTLRLLPPSKLRLQGRSWGCADRRGPDRGRIQRRGQGLAYKRQDHRDESSQRDPVSAARLPARPKAARSPAAPIWLTPSWPTCASRTLPASPTRSAVWPRTSPGD